MSKIEVIQGNILHAKENIIVHQVNCKGVMGAGLAKQIRNEWIEVFHEYRRYVDSVSDDRELLGQIQSIEVEKDKYVINMFAQLDYGRNPYRIYTDYHAMYQCFVKVREFMLKNNLSLAIPYEIGCGSGRGSWEIVRAIISDIFQEEHDRVKIYKLV